MRNHTASNHGHYYPEHDHRKGNSDPHYEIPERQIGRTGDNELRYSGLRSNVSPLQRSAFQTEYRTQYSNHDSGSYITDLAPVDDDTYSYDRKISSTSHEFCQNSSLHGIQYIGDPNVNRYRRFIWAIYFIGSLCFFLYAVIPRVTYYLRNPVRTKISIQSEKPMEFPSVTICNFNHYTEQYLKMNPILYETMVSDAGRYERMAAENQLDKKLNKSTLHVLDSITYHQVVEDGSHTLDMFIRCQLGHQLLNCFDYLEPRNTDFGRCYTFHSRKVQNDLNLTLHTDSSGSEFGFTVMATIEQYQYSQTKKSPGNSAGMKVLVHDRDDFPLVKEFGFAIQPGSETFAAIQRKNVKFLPSPYENSRCNDTNDPRFKNPLRYFNQYGYSACRLECRNNYTIRQCGCTCGEIATNASVPYCTLRQWLECAKVAEKRYYQDSHEVDRACGCFIPCEGTEYLVKISSAMFPSDKVAEDIANLEKGSNLTTQFLRHNFLLLRVYFEEMNYELIEEEPDYTWQQLIADIGGQMGFCMGASILSIYEVVEYLYRVSTRTIQRIAERIRRKRSQTLTKSYVYKPSRQREARQREVLV